MGFFDGLFGSSDEPYPTKHTGTVPPACGSGPYEAANRGGFFNRLFAPRQLNYPTPACYSGNNNPSVLTYLKPPALPQTVYVGTPNPTPTAASPAAAQVGASPQAATPGFLTLSPNGPQVIAQPVMVAGQSPPAPSMIIVQQPVMASGSSAPTLASSPANAPAVASTASQAPLPNGANAPINSIAVGEPYPAASASKVIRAYVFNPDFTSCARTAQAEFLAKELDCDDSDEDSSDTSDADSSRMISRDGTPVAFVVPNGCDSVDLLCGPIEVNPGEGCDGDLDQVITVGAAKTSANVCGLDGPLTPGDQVIVTLPWRAASWVDLPANRLRVQLLAHFYNSQLSD